MEIDIFPIPHRKDGMARNFDKGFLGILIISYIIAAFKTALCIVGNDAEKELVCFLLTIPIFVGYYALFVLVCHGIKTGLYAYFKFVNDNIKLPRKLGFVNIFFLKY